MNSRHRRRLALAGTMAAGLAGVTVGTTSVSATAGGQLSLSLCSPTTQSFTTVINNPYSPFPAGASWHYSDGATPPNTTDVTVEGSTTRADVFHFGTTSVQTIDVTETDHNADGTSDVSRNWYAQTTAGTVCYFGEIERDFDAGGNLIQPDPAPGSWCSGVSTGCTLPPGSNFAPGIVMPARPQVGQKFQQEFAPGVAEDEGQIVGIDSSDTVNGTTYHNVVRMLEGDDLASGQGHTDTKLFAPNVGAIRDEALLLVSFTP